MQYPDYKYSRGGSNSAVHHPISHLFRFSLVVAASLLFVESLAIHPSPNIHSHSRRSTSCNKVVNHRHFNVVSPSELQSTSKPGVEEEAEEQLVINGDGSEKIDAVIHAIKKDNDSAIQLTSSKRATKERISIWPQGDELDKRITKIALPCIANFAINVSFLKSLTISTPLFFNQ